MLFAGRAVFSPLELQGVEIAQITSAMVEVTRLVG